MDHSVATLEPSTIMFIEPRAVRDLFIQVPHTAAAFWRSMLIDASIFREWMTNIGQRNAYSRLAHLLCELMTRMKAVGLASEDTCELPITQAELADATGISTVHVNRSLQSLRGDGLIRWQAGSLTVLDWERLKEAGEFEQDYLHLRERVA
jgi:CRP-like cAMP-binding protein